MVTLTKTAYYARKTIIYGIVTIVALFFLRIGYSSFMAYWKKTHPPPPPPPNVLFGKLPVLEFPKNGAVTSILSYKLDTVTGSFPKMPSQLKVYFIPSIAGNLVGLDSANEQARSMDFDSQPEKIDDRNYRWIDSQQSHRKLAMDIVSGNLNLVYDYREDASIFSEKELPGKDQAILEARKLLDDFNLLRPDLEKGRATATFLKMDNDNNITEVNSLIEANFIRISFLRDKIDDLPVYYSSPEKAPVTVILSGSRDRYKRLVNLDYNYQVVDYENSATYPVISPDKAFENLKAGRGYVLNFNGNKKEAVVREIALGYYDSERPQIYLQPLYVFTGDNDFIGYVPAISEEWINK